MHIPNFSLSQLSSGPLGRLPVGFALDKAFHVMPRKLTFLIPTVVSTLAFAGCGSSYHSLALPTLHGPEVAQRGEIVSGLAASAASSQYYTLSEFSTRFAHVPFPLAYARFGIIKGMDIGLKMWGVPIIATGGLAADGQYVFLEDPINASLDLEISWAHRVDLAANTGGFKNLIGVFPSILVGSKWLYVGAKLVNVFDPSNPRVSVPGGFGGFSFGGDLKNLGELRILGETSFFPRPDESPLIFYTVGVQVTFNTQ